MVTFQYDVCKLTNMSINFFCETMYDIQSPLKVLEQLGQLHWRHLCVSFHCWFYIWICQTTYIIGQINHQTLTQLQFNSWREDRCKQQTATERCCGERVKKHNQWRNKKFESMGWRLLQARYMQSNIKYFWHSWKHFVPLPAHLKETGWFDLKYCILCCLTHPEKNRE